MKPEPCPRCEALVERVELLEEQLRQARSTVADPQAPRLPIEWGLTAHEARLVIALARHGACSKARILNEIYADRIADAEVPQAKIVDVFVCKARRKLAPFDIEIVTRWGVGYELSDASRNAVREYLQLAVAA